MILSSKNLIMALFALAVAFTTFASPAFGWVEGANVKINTDGTFQLQNEEACIINPLNPDNVVAVWRDFRLGFRRIGLGRTTNGGTTWTDSLISVPPYDRHSDPIMSYDADGNILINILAFPSTSGNSGLFTYTSTDGGLTWSEPVAAVDEGDPSTFEDKQWMNVDRTNGTYRNRIYLPWARFAPNSRIFLVHSITPTLYSSPVAVSDNFSVQWPTVSVTPDGTVLVAWVNFGQSRISLDRSTDGGDTWGVDKTVASLSGIPGSINGGIQIFPYPAMETDVTGGPYNGTTYILYTPFAGDGKTDAMLLRSTDKGDTWNPAVRVNDDPLGNNIDQFHPWISINEDGILTATWYDRRLDAANFLFDLYMAHSFDGGSTWTANRRISVVSSSPAQALKLDREFYANWNDNLNQPDEWFDAQKDPRAGLIGEYTGLSTRGDVAHVVFTDTRNGNQDAYSARVTIGLTAPPLVSPAGNLVSANNQPTFSWKKSGATPAEIANFPGTKVRPLLYRVDVDDDSTFASPNYQQSGIVGTSYQFASPLGDGQWYWRVEGVNDSGRVTGYAEPFRRLLIDTQAPDAPTLVSPALDETVAYTSQSFEWTAVNKEVLGSPVTYRLEVSSDPGFGSVVFAQSNIFSTTYVHNALLPDGDTLYYRVRANDQAGNNGSFSAGRRFLTTQAFVCGDADGNGLVNISDAVFLIGYIFSGGPSPNPIAAGDPDCNGLVSISDVVYLISYIFSGGAAPCAAC